MAARLSPLDRIARIDADVSILRERLDAKLAERRLLLAGLIADGESLRVELDEETRVLQHAVSIATNGRALTDDQVRTIRRLYKEGVSQAELARRYGIAQPSVHKIIHRRSYADVA